MTFKEMVAFQKARAEKAWAQTLAEREAEQARRKPIEAKWASNNPNEPLTDEERAAAVVRLENSTPSGGSYFSSLGDDDD
jgi:hypothetical protein